MIVCRCVKVVKLNQQAQWEFFLQKLNSMYAAPEPSKKENTGPLKLPIPIEEEPAETGTPPPTATPEPTTPEPTTQPPTDTPFLIVVANTTDPMDTAPTSSGTEGMSTVTEEPTYRPTPTELPLTSTTGASTPMVTTPLETMSTSDGPPTLTEPSTLANTPPHDSHQQVQTHSILE